MPEKAHLDVSETFESQKALVTTLIIPALFKVLDPVTYPIGEGVLYEMIHQRHRHQREEFLNAKKDETEIKKVTKRRHAVSRRNEVIY